MAGNRLFTSSESSLWLLAAKVLKDDNILIQLIDEGNEKALVWLLEHRFIRDPNKAFVDRVAFTSSGEADHLYVIIKDGITTSLIAAAMERGMHKYVDAVVRKCAFQRRDNNRILYSILERLICNSNGKKIREGRQHWYENVKFLVSMGAKLDGSYHLFDLNREDAVLIDAPFLKEIQDVINEGLKRGNAILLDIFSKLSNHRFFKNKSLVNIMMSYDEELSRAVIPLDFHLDSKSDHLLFHAQKR